MSTSIDQRIVSMRFDNAQFEAGAKESIKTLGELKDSLNLDSSAKKLKGFSVAPLLSGINGLSDSFTALDIVAITAISNITTALMDKLGGALKSTLGQIYSGGLKRATNLEQARFSMQGLLYDTDEAGKSIERYGITTEQVINGPVLNAVRDTAYGLDEAAKAASNFIASGVTDLDDLETVLKSISGTAAQTGSTYEDIAHIYTRVAGNNRLYAIDLQSFAARGVNAAAAVRDYLNDLDDTVNYTEADIRDLVSDGAVNLELFSKAMYEAFGRNAFRANETYSGSLSNLNAALSRLGAKFESKKLENMRNIFVALIPLVDTLSEAMDPLINVITGFSTSIANFAVDKIGKIEGFIKKISSAPEGTNEIREILDNFDALTEGMSKIDKIKYRNELESKLVPSIERIKNSLINFVKSIGNIGSAFKTFFSPLGEFIKRLSGGLLPIIENVSSGFLSFTERLKNGASEIVSAVSKFKETNKYFKLLESVISLVGTSIKTFVKSATSMGSTILSVFGPAFTSVLSKASSVLSPVAEKLTEFFNLVSEFVSSKMDFSNFSESLESAFSGIGNSLSPISEKLSEIKDKIIDFFKSIIDTVHQVLPELTLKNIFGWLLDFKVSDIIGTLTGITNPIGTFINTINDIFKDTNINDSFESIINGPEKLTESLSGMSPVLSKASTSLLGFKDGMLKTAEGIDVSSVKFTALDKIKIIIEQIGSIISKIGSKISNTFSKIGESINNFFSKINFTNVSTGIVAGSMTAIAYEIIRFANDIRKIPRDLTKSVTELCDSIKEAFNSLSDTFTGVKTAAMLQSIKAFAVAILLTAAAFKLLSTIDVEGELKPSVIGLSVIIGELSVAFTLMSKFADVKNLRGISGKLIAFSTSILILSASMKVLSSIKEDELARGISAIERMTLCILAYAGMMSIINSKLGSGGKSGAALVSMGVSMLLMAKAVENLGSIDSATIDKGIAAIGKLLIFVGVYNVLSRKTSGISQGAGLVLMASSLLIFVGAIQLLGMLKPEVITQGLNVIFALLATIGLYLNFINQAKPIQAATGLLILSGALVVLSGALMVIGNLPLDNLKPGPVAALLAGLLALVVALRIIGDKGSIKSSVSILIVSAALVVLANALAILSLIPFSTLAANLVLIIGGLAILGAMSTLISSAAVALKAVSSAFAIFGLAVLAIAVSITMLTPVLAAFTVGMLGSLNLMVQGIIEMKDRLTEGFAALIEILFNAIKSTIDLIVSVIIELGTAILTGFQELVSPVIELIKTLFYAIVDTIVEFIPYIVESFLLIIKGILEAIANNISGIVQAGMQIVIEFLNGIAQKLPDLIDSAFNLVISFINGIADAIRNNAEEVGKAAWNLASALVEGFIKAITGFMKNPVKKVKELGENIKNGFKEKINGKAFTTFVESAMGGIISGIGKRIGSAVSKAKEIGDRIVKKVKEFLSVKNFSSIGGDIVTGIINGLSGLASRAIEKAKNLAKDIWSGFKSVLGINSPSTKFLQSGKDIVTGLNNGVKDYTSVTNTVSNMGKSLFEKASSWLNQGKFKPLGKDVTTGIEDGMDKTGPTGRMTEIAKNIKTVASDNLKDTQFNTYGKNVTTGIKDGMNSKIPEDYVRSTAASVKRTSDYNFVSTDFNKYGSRVTSGLKGGMDASVPSGQAKYASQQTYNSVSTNLKKSLFETIGENVVIGLKIGVQRKQQKAIDQANEMARKIYGAAAREFVVQSPSRLFMRLGGYLMEGLAIGIQHDTINPVKAVVKASEMISDKFGSLIDSENDFTITPVLDLSEIQNGITDLDGMFSNKYLSGVSANVNGSINSVSVMSAFDKLSALIGGIPNQMLDPDEIYNAVREGASNAVINLMLDGEKITTTVNNRNNDSLNTMLSFYGG